MATLSSIKEQFSNKTGAVSLLSESQRQTALTRAKEAAEEAKNQGGFFGGIGYFFEKIGLGFLGGIEGIWDYAAGGLAKLFGADDWAEQQFANDWVNYNHADEWFNPDEGWKTAGDVAGGIGSSLPAIAAVAAAGAIAYFSGGSLSAVSAGLISATVSGLGAAGGATKEAYRQTGELGAKEFGYGAMVGVTEGAIEGVSSVIGAGTGSIVKNISKSFGKELTQTVARDTVVKSMFKGFISEAFEEGVQTALDPVYKRLTYDPNAKNATLQEISYSALVGGLSGALMTGFDTTTRNTAATIRGSNYHNKGLDSSILEDAEKISQYEVENETGYAAFENVKNIYNELAASLEKTGGKVETIKQKMLLGMLNDANTAAVFTPFVAKSAENIVKNAEIIAQRLNTYDYRDANGNAIQFTAEQILDGIDMTDQKSFAKSFSNAMRTNSVLRALSVVDATGQLFMNTAEFKNSVLRGEKLFSQVDINRFNETATDSEKAAVAEKLGIKTWEGVTTAELQEKIQKFVENNGIEESKQARLIVKDAMKVGSETAKSYIPRVSTAIKQDGVHRFTQGETDIAIIKDGDKYRLFDYKSNRLSKVLTKKELNKVLQQINSNNANVADSIRKNLEQEATLKQEVEQLDAYAKENIKDYAKLNDSNKSMIRSIIRQGRVAGISEDFILTTARISARSGLNVVFSKELSFVAASGKYADGAIDLKNNRIIINPESKSRTGEMVLIHELTHAIYKSDNGVLQVAEGLEIMTDAEKESIRKRYSAIGKGKAVEVADEINAHFAEQTLVNKNILERLVQDKPTLKEKILNFFKKSAKDYSEDAKLTGAAKKLYKQYKKLFDAFAAQHQQSNSVENIGVNDKNYALSDDNNVDNKENKLVLEQENVYNNKKLQGIDEKDVPARLQNAIIDFTIKDINNRLNAIQSSISHNEWLIKDTNTPKNLIPMFEKDLKELRNEERKSLLQYEEITKEQARANSNNNQQEWRLPEPYSERLREIQQDFSLQENSETIEFLVSVINSAKLYKDYDLRKITDGFTVGNLGETIRIVDPDCLPRNLIDLKQENSELGIRTWFFVDRSYQSVDVGGFYVPTTDKMFLLLDKVAPLFNTTNRHEKTHYFESEYPELYSYYKSEIDKVLTQKEKDALYEKYYSGYVNEYSSIPATSFERYIWGEVYANIYSLKEINKIKNKNGIYEANERFDNALKQEFNINHEIMYALSDEDSEGNKLSDAQRRYFANTKVVDDNGKLLVLYHGTPNMFNIFKNGHTGLYGAGMYFTEDIQYANNYSKGLTVNGNSVGGRVISAYINLENPLVVENLRDLDEVIYNAEREEIHEDGFFWAKRKENFSFYDWVRENYDGIIVESPAADQPDVGMKGKFVIAFNSNQIKETTNINPTINDDIRYALSEDSDIKELVAVHNTTESKLLQTIELGGLPMPSIAIIKGNMDHEGFGNISLILKSRSIDPEYDYNNKIYSADAYSPRFPRVAYSLNAKELRNLADKINTSVSMLEANDFAEGNSRERIIDSLKYNDNFIRYYLKEFNISREIAYKNPEYSNTIYLYEEMKDFLKKDYSLKELLNNSKIKEELDAAFEKAKNKQDKIFKKNLMQRSYDKLLQQFDAAREESYIFDEVEKQYNYDKDIAQGKAKEVEDSYQTRQNTIEKLKNDGDFNAYVEKTVDKIINKKYLRNNKDYYTNSGNPRPFSALYEEYNAENAVRIMKEQGGKNSEGGNIFGFGIGEIRAALSKRYNNISEVRKDKNKIQSTTEDGAALYEECNNELHNIADRLSKRVKTGNFLEERDIALNAIFDIISSTKTNEQAHRLMKRDYSFDVSDAEIIEIRELANKVAELPVKYFESKPERVVSFNEIVKVFIPEGTSEKITEFFSEKGIDVQVYNETSPTRAELIKTLPEDIKFALSTEDDTENKVVGGLTKAQRAKFVANNTKLKVYSKSEAESVINSIISERLNFDERYAGSLDAKNKKQVIEYLFKELNRVDEGYRGNVALNIADFMIQNAVLEDMWQDSADTDIEFDKSLVSYMNRLRNKFDLSSIKGEILNRFDKNNTIFLQWGKTSGGYGPDAIAQEFESMGFHSFKSSNAADQFFEMLDAYNAAKKRLNTKVEKQMLNTYGDIEQLEQVKQEITRDILLAYDNKGEQSKFGKLVEKYTNKINDLVKQNKELKTINRLSNSIIDKAQKLKDSKLGNYLNATQYNSDVFDKSISKLSNIKYRGNLNQAGTRRIVAEFSQWYNESNPMLNGCYEQEIADMLNEITYGDGKLTQEDLITLNNILTYFNKFVENYKRVYKQGKWIEAIPEAERYIDIIHKNEQLKSGIFAKVAGTTYMQTFGDPMTVARRMDKYENGFYTEMMLELREASVDSEIAEMEVKENYENFLKKNKKYISSIESEKVEYRGVSISKTHLIGLYMTLKRKHAQKGLAQNGFAFLDEKGKRIRVDGFANNVVFEEVLQEKIAQEQTEIEKLLSETDKEYIKILEKAYNQDVKELKVKRDMERLGFTNALEDYYYPIKRGNIAKNVDTSEVSAEIDRVSSASFNKDTVKGAKQELFIEPVDVVFNRHVKAVCKYAYLSPAIDTYNRLYNVDISENRNKPISVATESANTWSKGNKYFSKLISDIQGIPSSSSEGMKVLGFIRGSYAKYQLGANPKVWVTQLSSIFASSSILDADSIAKGVTVSAANVDKYCKLAKLRNKDNTAAMAQGVLNRLNKVSDVLMAPIGKMDRFVVCRLFGACQVQVEKNNGLKVGTEANKVEAGKLLKRVILETQQNSMATERSAAMRSGNEILKTLTMFTADSMKVIGRVIDSIGEYSTLKIKIKNETDVAVKEQLTKQLKTAKRKARKSVTALITSAAFMAGVAQLFKFLYAKDQEDEEVAEMVVVDFVGNLFGGLPVIKDIYARLAEGYDLDMYAYSTMNNMLDSAIDIFDAAGKLVSGNATSQDIASSLKKLTYSAGQLFGVPVRNVYNIAYGLTKRVSPTTAYKIDNVFYKKNYLTDLKKAINNDDMEMVSMLTNMVMAQRVGSANISDKLNSTIYKLYSKGYSVLPKSVPSEITHENETYTLNSTQADEFKNIYSQAAKYVEKMVNSRNYLKLSEELQAKAIKQIYDAYYNIALTSVLGIEKENNFAILSKYIDADKLAVYYAGVSDIAADKNSSGKTIQNSKKKKVIDYLSKQGFSDEEVILLLSFNGYSLQDREYKHYTSKQARLKLLRYIMNLKGVTKDEKAKLAEMCGFEVKNGRIVTKSLYMGNK